MFHIDWIQEDRFHTTSYESHILAATIATDLQQRRDVQAVQIEGPDFSQTWLRTPTGWFRADDVRIA